MYAFSVILVFVILVLQMCSIAPNKCKERIRLYFYPLYNLLLYILLFIDFMIFVHSSVSSGEK